MQLVRVTRVEKERRGVVLLGPDLRPVKNRILSPRTTNPFQCISLLCPPSSLSHLCVASPSSSPTTLTLFHTGHPLSLFLSPLTFYTTSSLPLSLSLSDRPSLPNHLTSHRPFVCSPFLPHFAPVSRLLSPSLPVPLVPVLLSIQQVPGHASQISHVRGGDAEITTASVAGPRALVCLEIRVLPKFPSTVVQRDESEKERSAGSNRR